MPGPAVRAESDAVTRTDRGLELVEAEWHSSAGAGLIERLVADLDERYAPSTGGVEPPVAKGARPAPPSAAPDDPRWPVDAATVARPHGAFVVARLDGSPVGCGALRPLPGGPPGVGEVKRMFTTPEARGRGVARAALARLVAIAEELGYTGLVLETGTRQLEALALYQAAGWHPLEPYGEYREHSLSRCYGLDVARRGEAVHSDVRRP